MSDLDFEIGGYLLALILAALPFFIKQNTLPVKITVALLVVGISYAGIRNAIKRSEDVKTEAGEKTELKRQMGQLTTGDSLGSLSDKEVLKKLDDINVALKKVNAVYDPVRKKIVFNTINNYGEGYRVINDEQLLECVSSAFGNKAVDKSVQIILIVEGTTSDSRELQESKDRMIEVLNRNGYKNVNKQLHFDDIENKDKTHCVYKADENYLQIRFPAYPK